jgi:hypothetical protein
MRALRSCAKLGEEFVSVNPGYKDERHSHGTGQSIVGGSIDEPISLLDILVIIDEYLSKSPVRVTTESIRPTHSHDGTENLFSHRHALRVLGQDDSRLHKVPFRIIGASPVEDLATLFLGLVDIPHDFIESRLSTGEKTHEQIDKSIVESTHITGPMKLSHCSEGPTLIFAVSSSSCALNCGQIELAT